jgi:hypothetical protein
LYNLNGDANVITFARNAKIRITPDSYIQCNAKGEPTSFVGPTAVNFFRLHMIWHGLKLEVENPGMRLTRKAPKCTTLVKQEFGFKGTPAKLLEQMNKMMEVMKNPEAHGLPVFQEVRE